MIQILSFQDLTSQNNITVSKMATPTILSVRINIADYSPIKAYKALLSTGSNISITSSKELLVDYENLEEPENVQLAHCKTTLQIVGKGNIVERGMIIKCYCSPTSNGTIISLSSLFDANFRWESQTKQEAIYRYLPNSKSIQFNREADNLFYTLLSVPLPASKVIHIENASESKSNIINYDTKYQINPLASLFEKDDFQYCIEINDTFKKRIEFECLEEMVYILDLLKTADSNKKYELFELIPIDWEGDFYESNMLFNFLCYHKYLIEADKIEPIHINDDPSSKSKLRNFDTIYKINPLAVLINVYMNVYILRINDKCNPKRIDFKCSEDQADILDVVKTFNSQKKFQLYEAVHLGFRGEHQEADMVFNFLIYHKYLLPQQRRIFD